MLLPAIDNSSESDTISHAGVIAVMMNMSTTAKIKGNCLINFGRHHFIYKKYIPLNIQQVVICFVEVEKMCVFFKKG